MCEAEGKFDFLNAGSISQNRQISLNNYLFDKYIQTIESSVGATAPEEINNNNLLGKKRQLRPRKKK